MVTSATRYADAMSIGAGAEAPPIVTRGQSLHDPVRFAPRRSAHPVATTLTSSQRAKSISLTIRLDGITDERSRSVMVTGSIDEAMRPSS